MFKVNIEKKSIAKELDTIETTDNLLENKIDNIENNSEVSEANNDFMTLKIEKDNFLDKTKINTDIEKNNLFKSRGINRTRFGNTFPLLFRDGEPRIVIGPHWPFFLCLSSFISSIFYMLMYSFWDKISDILKLFGFLIYFIQITSYSYTALINPGIPKNSLDLDGDLKESLKTIRNYRICKICNVIMDKDINTMHCDECNACIEGHDHHCPWTTKCIGKGNLKAFYSFVGFSLVLMGYVFVCLISIQNN